jgi:hypothetical protein
MAPKIKSNPSWPQILAFRLARHSLSDQSPEGLVAVSRDVCGIQAQVMTAAHMALWARTRGVRPADIDSALYETRSLVKTLCMRRTLHLVPSDDFPVYISALRPSRMAALMRVMSRFGITQRDVDLMNRAVMKELGAAPVTRARLSALIRPKMAKKVQAWMDRVSSPFSPAITEGLICYGPNRGTETTFVRIDQWLPGQKAISEQEAKRLLFRRYLRAYGPATLQDLCYWSGISAKEAGAVPDLLAGELTRVEITGKPGLIMTEDHAELMDRRPVKDSVRLLPGFDPYMLGHADKTPLINPDNYKRVYRNQGWISPIALLNGEVVAIWSHTRRAKTLSIEIEPLRPVPRKICSLIEEEATSLGAFLEASTEVTIR